MGGRGSASGIGANKNGGSNTGNVTKVSKADPKNMSMEELHSERANNDLKIKAVGDVMDEIVKRRDVNTTVMPEEYYRVRTIYSELQSRNMDLTLEIGRRKTEESRKNRTVIPKTFVNSFGEATSREITSASYKRALERTKKAILRNMGIK